MELDSFLEWAKSVAIKASVAMKTHSMNTLVSYIIVLSAYRRKQNNLTFLTKGHVWFC